MTLEAHLRGVGFGRRPFDHLHSFKHVTGQERQIAD